MNFELEKRIEELESWKQSMTDFSNFPYDEISAIKKFFPNFLIGQATLNFGNTVSGGNEVLTIPVGGARPGDAVFIGLPATGVVDGRRIFTAYVSAADTVSLYFSNESAGDVNPDSGLYTAVVVQKQ